MPNKFSHALVLSTYESRGLIDLPPPLLPSLHSSSTSEQNRPSSDDATTPSLSALPALASDSSTASINSSLDLHPPRLPTHVPSSSSIVTEVYAPQSPPLEPQTTVAAADDHLSELHSPLPSKHSPPERPSSQPTSRFSSWHTFSAFLDLPSHVKRHRRRPRQHSRCQDSPPEHIVPVTSTAKTPPPPQTPHPHNPPSGRPHPDNKQQQHYLPHSRLHPILSIDSLRSRHLTHADEKDTLCPQSPNMDVLPWEYPSSDPPPPPSPPVSLAPHVPHVLTATTTTTATPNIPPHPRSASLSHPPLPSLHNDDPPASDETDPIFKPIFPTDEELLPGELRVERPRSRAESFDSAAPPPIRKGPWGVPGGKGWSVR
ncbi:MAG: hypothetical protein LQ344_007443 [Seirophora lacunosa]|nr:MAG: hypothetical protein LQ344_007443 [Seirophora lacunosa]